MIHDLLKLASRLEQAHQELERAANSADAISSTEYTIGIGYKLHTHRSIGITSRLRALVTWFPRQAPSSTHPPPSFTASLASPEPHNVSNKKNSRLRRQRLPRLPHLPSRRRPKLGRHIRQVSLSKPPQTSHSPYLTPHPSRSGPPHWPSTTGTPPAWSHKVSWERADIFRPAQWTPLLHHADYVVHSLGILLEADYKGVLSGRESPIAGLRKAFSPHPYPEPPNPLARVRGTEPEPQPASSSPAQLTYELMNRDSAILLAKEAARAGVGAFGFVSAAAGTPVLPGRYISTKREAEAVVAREFPAMRGVFFRPPFMYDRSRGVTMGVAAVARAGSVVDELTGGVLKGVFGAAVTKPLKVDVVADAVVEALADEGVRGPVEVRELEELAGRAWRRTML